MLEDDGKGPNAATALQRERFLVALFLLFAMLFVTHFVHQAWDYAIGTALSHGAAAAAPKRYAPDVYRVFMPTLVTWLMRLLPGHNAAAAYSLLDFCFGYAALYGGYLLTAAGLGSDSEQQTQRATRIAFYLACVQFPLAWIVPYQRPETLPSALYLVACTLLLQATARNRLWAAPLLALTLLQALVRSDVACMFGLSILLLSLAGNTLRSIAPRAFTALIGFGMAAIAIVAQAYLQLVRFPHMTYAPGTVTVMAGINLQPHFFIVLCLVLLPVFCIVAVAIMLRLRLSAVQVLSIVAAALYLPLWFAVGSVTEVRIFVPFLILLCPTAAAVLATALLPADPATPSQRAA